MAPLQPKQIESLLPGFINNKHPVILWGPPGIGKSDIVKQAAAKLGRAVRDVRAVLLDPVDLRGIPSISDKGLTKWCPPDFLPQDPDSTEVFFLDEFAQAPPLVQSACLELLLDRRIGDYKLPDNCAIVAASNRATDRAGAHKMITPMLNRLTHFEMCYNADDWHNWAVAAGVDHRVTSFIKFKPAALFDFDPSGAENAFPTPRSWVRASEVIQHAPGSLLLQAVAGCVGSGPAAEFVNYVNICESLPDIRRVLANPETEGVPGEPSVRYAICGALVNAVREDNNNLDAAMTYGQRLPNEFATNLVLDFIRVCPGSQKNPRIKEWVGKNSDVIMASRADS